jgi:hypothetical protein
MGEEDAKAYWESWDNYWKKNNPDSKKMVFLNSLDFSEANPYFAD